jgi:hypothetical protein
LVYTWYVNSKDMCQFISVVNNADGR